MDTAAPYPPHDRLDMNITYRDLTTIAFSLKEKVFTGQS
jgi:hypothetical protein